MIQNAGKRIAVILAATALVVTACGSSSVLNGTGNGGTNNGGAAGGSSLSSGLSSNLDKLTSYKFSWQFFGASSGGASPADSGGATITGTVVNSPTKAVKVNYFGMDYIQIGSQQWASFDNGSTWTATGASGQTDLSSMLPTADYTSWFDTNSGQFAAAGEETRNGVDCIHYKGNDSLSKVYSAVAGVSANFSADLWVAKDGNYPVSGAYGFSASSAGQTGAFGYSFDITDVNSSSNSITAPANAAAMPS